MKRLVEWWNAESTAARVLNAEDETHTATNGGIVMTVIGTLMLVIFSSL